VATKGTDLMNIRGLANGATQAINPNETVSVLRSTGSTPGPGARQVPSYAASVSASAQVQALDGDDLKQIEGLNIQGNLKAIYIYGELAGVLRPNQTGGDLIKRKNDTETWLVVKILEAWPNWVKAVIVLQGPN
jgi:hypothetical protein